MSGFLATLRQLDSHPRVVALVRAGRLRARRWRFSAKGAPKGLKVYTARPES